jgi:hypothetical protein
VAALPRSRRNVVGGIHAERLDARSRRGFRPTGGIVRRRYEQAGIARSAARSRPRGGPHRPIRIPSWGRAGVGSDRAVRECPRSPKRHRVQAPARDRSAVSRRRNSRVDGRRSVRYFGLGAHRGRSWLVCRAASSRDGSERSIGTAPSREDAGGETRRRDRRARDADRERRRNVPHGPRLQRRGDDLPEWKADLLCGSAIRLRGTARGVDRLWPSDAVSSAPGWTQRARRVRDGSFRRMGACTPHPCLGASHQKNTQTAPQTPKKKKHFFFFFNFPASSGLFRSIDCSLHTSRDDYRRFASNTSSTRATRSCQCALFTAAAVASAAFRVASSRI